MALMMRHPTRDDWASVRPTVERFRKEQHTAERIARQLGILYGYRITKKMVYDRLREWNAPPKYQRQKSHHRIIRAIRTPSGDFQMQATLASIGGFLDSFAEQTAWQSPELYLDHGFQRLVAEALMAISSISYDAKAVWHELRGMEQRVQSMISSFNVTVHPRVLSVLLRLLVQNRQTGQIERNAVKLVKEMICRKSIDSLQPTHPVASLAALDLPPEKTKDFLANFTRQLDSRLHDRISESAPDFVALEKIYTARALASFGFPGTADTILESASSLSVRDAFARAGYHRTIGFSQFQKNTPETIDAALENLQLALDLFETVGKGSSVEAMYVHYNLGSVYERMCESEGCVQHLEAALEIWEMNTPAHQQHGGIKYVRDLHEAYKRLDWVTNTRCLRDRYAAYFEESRLAKAGGGKGSFLHGATLCMVPLSAKGMVFPEGLRLASMPFKGKAFHDRGRRESGVLVLLLWSGRTRSGQVPSNVSMQSNHCAHLFFVYHLVPVDGLFAGNLT